MTIKEEIRYRKLERKKREHAQQTRPQRFAAIVNATITRLGMVPLVAGRPVTYIAGRA